MTSLTAFSRSRLLCGTALSILAVAPALAQETSLVPDADGALDAYTLDPIEVRKQDPLGEAADRATSAYVSESELERASMGDLRDLFAGIASVSVGGAIPVAQKIFVNGVDMLNLAVQVDGVSQNNRVFHHASANAFDPGLMQAVRVDPGVAPADAGPGAVAGRVVMETVDVDNILQDGDNFGGQARFSYADNGDVAGGSLTLAGRSNGFEVLANGKRVTGDNYEDGNGDIVLGTTSDMNVGLLKLAYQSDQGHRVELSGQRLRDTALRNRRANFGNAPWNPLTNVYDTERTIYSLRYENVHGGGNWDPSVTLGYSENEIGSLTPSDSAIGNTRSYSATFQNRFHLSGNGTITAGLDYLDQKSSASGDFWGSNSPYEESRTVGIFAQARLEPTDRLNLSAGLRYDWNSFTGQDFAQTGSAFSDDSSGLSGNLSLSYALTDTLSLRAGYSNVFGGYVVEDNFLFYQAWDYTGLQARRGENIVVGADWNWGGLTLGGEVFRTKIEDTRGLAGPVVGSYDFESRGYNLGATYGWGSGLARMTFSDSENYVNGEKASSFYVLDSGAPLGQVLSLQVQQELAQLNMVVGGHLDAAFTYSHNANEADPVTKLEGYEVVNVFAEYHPPSLDNVVIRASIDNLFDRAYADRATYGGDYPGFPTLNEPGRTFSMVATVKF
ncbi:TonB-dependent receptor plug domain-containing protein [Shimia sp.]|uniref:TonB-dependent receptor plug domain-containing protein n=1 Tax=Shimia sp. TaxID=1954381 RepID=UPI003BA9AAA7